MAFRIVNALMTGLFALAAAVQYNDPDPIRWMTIYSAAAALSVWTVVRGAPPRILAAGVGLVALVWGIVVLRGIGEWQNLAHLFDSWEMKSPRIEEAREGCGLLIVAVWMAVLTIQTRRLAARGASPSSHRER